MKFEVRSNEVRSVTGRPCGSVAQWSECSHGLREVLGSSPGRAMCYFLPCDSWWPLCVCGGGESVTEIRTDEVRSPSRASIDYRT